jgi:hypothetical protein
MAITRVSGSAMRYSSTSAAWTIASLPRQMTLDKPTAWVIENFSMTVVSAPLYRTIPIPRRGTPMGICYP